MASLTRLLGVAAGAYLMGSTPSADIAARVVSGGAIDVRAGGTGNPGGTNARRLLGSGVGYAVVVADVGKGFVACAWGRRRADEVGAHVAGVAAVAGHCYPPWARFRGGKGVATSFGQCLYTFPVWAPVDVAVAVAASRIPRLRRPSLVAVGASSLLWLAASVVWWRRGLPNLWGPPPTATLPLANGATVLLIATRAVSMLRRREPDELVLPR
jgi:glycerol-3-phosphate acyltransferase PlsY